MSVVTDFPLPPTTASAALARGVTATWWYTATSVVLFQAVTLLMWLLPLLAAASDSGALPVALYLAAAAVSLASSVPLLLRYGRAPEVDPEERAIHVSATVVASLTAAAAAAVALGYSTGSVLCAASFAAFSTTLLRWRPAVRVRLLVVLVVVLVAVWIWEGSSPLVEQGESAEWVLPIFSVFLSPSAVLCLWWWDIVVALDRARGAEARLAAAQERLRLAGDLHDLQGHHLQVIALQLELAERMLPGDPAAAEEQVRLARASVDAARSGTRALAARFRGVPLPDELANAADLLVAAGLDVDLEVDSAAGQAPADILGPVVRESTTNVLKHGGGAWARLRLAPVDGGWLLTVANDPATAAPPASAGAGLRGISERVGAVGGTVQWKTSPEEFSLTVRVPRAAGTRNA